MGQDTRDWNDLIPEIKKLDDAGTPVARAVLDEENEVVELVELDAIEDERREQEAIDEVERKLAKMNKLSRDRDAIAALTDAMQYALREYVRATDTLPNRRVAKDLLDAAFQTVKVERELLSEWSDL